MAISFGKEDCQQQVINYSCMLQVLLFFTVFMHDLRGKARREGLGEVLAAVAGLS
jgi:hypothetical protein